MRTSVEAWGRVNSRMAVGMHEWSTLLPNGICPEARPQRTLFLGIDMHTSVEAWGRDSSRMPVGMHEWSTVLPSATCPEARRQRKSRRQTVPNTRGAERLPFPTASVPSNSNSHPSNSQWPHTAWTNQFVTYILTFGPLQSRFARNVLNYDE